MKCLDFTTERNHNLLNGEKKKKKCLERLRVVSVMLGETVLGQSIA